MNFPDMRTVIFSHVLTDVVCVLVIASLWVQTRKRIAGASYWVVNFVFQTMAVLLIILRGNIPDWMSIALPSTLVIAGALAGYMGLERFVGRISSQAHNYLLLAAFALVHSYFTFVQPNLEARTLNVSLGLLIVCFQCAWLMLRRVPPTMRSMTRDVGIVNVAYVLISLARIVVTLAVPQPTNDFFQSGTFDTLIMISYQMLLILLAYALTLMVNRRLLVDVQVQEEKFSKAFRSSPYAITLTRLSDGQILEVNDGFVNLTGYQYAEAIGRTTLDLHLWVREEDRAAVVEELSKSGRVQGRESQFRTKSGEVITGFFSAEIITLNNQPCALSSISDITERKRTEDVLRESEERFRTLVEGQGEGIGIADTEEHFVFANPAAENIFGVPPGGLIGRSLEEFTTPQQFAAIKEQTARRRAGEKNAYEMELIRPDGERRTILVTATPKFDNAGQFIGAFGIFRDITERKQLEEKLVQLSIHDALTGLYNRGFFEEEMARLERGRRFPISVVMADVDGLKVTNDREGHAAGDALLQRAAQVLSAAFRGEDVVARIGGDEFAVLLPNADADAAEAALRRVRHILQEQNAARDGTPVRLSLGASTAEKGISLTDALKQADERMYQEKREKPTAGFGLKT